METALNELALRQAVASLAPVLSQLAASGNVQTPAAAHQAPPVQSLLLQPPLPQPLFQSALPTLSPQPPQLTTSQPSFAAAADLNEQERQVRRHTKELKEAYERQFLAPKPPGGPTQVPGLPPLAPAPKPKNEKSQQGIPAATAAKERKPRTVEEQAAGSILLGFLSSLRKSYLDAVQDRDGSEDSAGAASALHRSHVTFPNGVVGPSAVTDASESQPSSEENYDWREKRVDPSSSEDSDARGEISRGPPRKRLKLKKDAQY